jgi:hypothetical protein
VRPHNLTDYEKLPRENTDDTADDPAADGTDPVT